jgi:hypothetical protein
MRVAIMVAAGAEGITMTNTENTPSVSDAEIVKCASQMLEPGFEFTPENVNKLTGHLNSADFMFVIQTVAANAIIERNKLLSMHTAKKMLAELEAAPGSDSTFGTQTDRAEDFLVDTVIAITPEGRWIDESTGREIEIDKP